MKSISQIRKLISNIPGVYREVPSEEQVRSEDPAINTLWNPEVFSDENITGQNETPDELSSDEALPLSPEEIFEYGAEIDIAELTKALGGNKGKEIKKAVEARGVDALGWYMPFHLQGAQPGIYIPISSIFWMMVNVYGKLDTDPWTKFKLSFRSIHQHELFHFASEYMMAQFEAIIGQAIYWKARDALRDAECGYHIDEEEYANAQMLLAIKYASKSLKISGKTALLTKFIKTQPAGYCSGAGYTKGCFDYGTNSHALFFLRERLNFPGNRYDYLENFDFLPLYPRFPTLDWRYCPINIIYDQERFNLPLSDLDLFRCVPHLVETEKFGKSLRKLPKDIMSRWDKMKGVLVSTTTLPGLDFKHWKNEGTLSIYSIRLNKAYRAHLGYERTKKQWFALNVGNHKQMGHG